MGKEEVQTRLRKWQGPIFPQEVEELNILFNKTRVGGERLQELVFAMDNFMGSNLKPKTSDGYEWFWALYFRTENGKVAVLFPWKNDTEEKDGFVLDRSIAVHGQGEKYQYEAIAILERIQLRLFKEREKQLAEAIHGVSKQITEKLEKQLVFCEQT